MHNLIHCEDKKSITNASISEIDSFYGRMNIISFQNYILFSSFEDLSYSNHYIKLIYPNIVLTEQLSNPILSAIDCMNGNSNSILNLLVIGSTFQISVWNELLKIPYTKTSTYKRIADSIHNPKSIRAVGAAVGANEHAILIPCHRVIYSDGHSGHFKWGAERKKKLLQMENPNKVVINELF